MLNDGVSACDHCAGAFGAADEVDESDAAALDEYESHPSVRSLVADGCEVLTR